MVKGLELFRDHFEEFTDCYILIGGAACDLVMEDAGLRFRTTKDLDIILCLEGRTAEFVAALWKFIRAGGYKVKERSDGRPQLFRFSSPDETAYPSTLEFFTREPSRLTVPEDAHLVPVQPDSSGSGLSAILLDSNYYDWVRDSSQMLEGIVVADAEHLIPLKAHAWRNLRKERSEGEQVDSDKVKKHRNDVLRLSQIIDPERSLGNIPPNIVEDVQWFVDDLRENSAPDNIPGVEATSDDIVETLTIVYGLT